MEARRRHGHGQGGSAVDSIWILALFFDVFERTGARAVVGLGLGIVLGLIKGVLGLAGVNVELSG